MTAMRAIIAAVADLLRVGRVPIARGRVIVNLDTAPVQLHTTTFQTGDPTEARNFSYLDRLVAEDIAETVYSENVWP